jgi:hypothetical protein
MSNNTIDDGGAAFPTTAKLMNSGFPKMIGEDPF